MSLIKVKSRGTDNVSSRRNLMVNGAMNVSQRATSFADPSNDTYTLDRFIARKSNDGAVTITQDSSAPSGFANSLKVDVTNADASIGTNQFSMIQHKIEAQDLQRLAFGTSSAKNFTLSFYVKSNKTGTYSVNISQSDNSSKQASLTYTINSADTWERKSLTFTGDTSGVINDDNGIGFLVYWVLAVGSTFTSGGSTSATFQTYANANLGAGHAVNLRRTSDAPDVFVAEAPEVQTHCIRACGANCSPTAYLLRPFVHARHVTYPPKTSADGRIHNLLFLLSNCVAPTDSHS